MHFIFRQVPAACPLYVCPCRTVAAAAAAAAAMNSLPICLDFPMHVFILDVMNRSSDNLVFHVDRYGCVSISGGRVSESRPLAKTYRPPGVC